MKRFIKNIPFFKSLYHKLRLAYRNKVTVPRRQKFVEHKIESLLDQPQTLFKTNKESNLIISLTSYPARIDSVHVTIESIFNQTERPWKIVLVLAENEFEELKLPSSIHNLIDRGLEVLWVSENTRSFKKLLPVQKRYPNSSIITVDDDILYEANFIESLLKVANKYPHAIIGNRGRLIRKYKEEILPYRDWPLISHGKVGNDILLTGMGGILYPPNQINETMLQDISSALKLCPNADDLWFWAVSVMSNTEIVCTSQMTFYEVDVGVSEESLSAINLENGANDIQFQRLLKQYDLADSL